MAHDTKSRKRPELSPVSPPPEPPPVTEGGKRGDFEDEASKTLARVDVLFDQKVSPFAPRRLMAAQALGLRFFKLSPAEREQLKDANFIYDGMFWDATIVSFLSTCPLPTLFRAMRTPEAVSTDIFDWADEHQIAPGSESFDQVLSLFTQIIQDMVVSHAEPIDPKAVARPEEAGLPGE